MKRGNKFMAILWKALLLALLPTVLVGAPVLAAPYGAGKFGANVPYGSATTLAINVGSNVLIQVTPTDSGTLGTASNTVTVTSTDVVGYQLYIRAAGSSDMTNGPYSIPASANGTPAALAMNTWGYNTDGSNNFAGITTSDVMIKNATGPYGSGDPTQVTYGVKVDNSKPAGNYTATVVYTAVPQTE